MAEAMPKRIVFCFDGTWNRLSANCPTNVVLIAQMVKPVADDRRAQVVYYDEGIGSRTSWPQSWFEGATGKGMLKILREAYRFLIFNYEPGDEIFAFGFSRGAYTARSFIGFIRHAGILDIASVTQIDEAIRIYREAPATTIGAESPEGLEFRAKYCTGVCVSAADRQHRIETIAGFDPATAPLLEIRYVGVWDTVRALGVPDFVPGAAWLNRRYGFHDAVLSSKIKAARHAVALDELRPSFRATLFGRDRIAELNRRNRRAKGPEMPPWKLHYQEKWFPGGHGAVGGGGPRRGLSDGALDWILDGARQRGLELRDRRSNLAYALRPDPFDQLQNDPKQPFYRRGLLGWLLGLADSPRVGPVALDDVALAALRRWHADPRDLPGRKPYRPGALAAISDAMDRWIAELPARSRPQTQADPADFEDYEVQPLDTLSALAKSRLGDGKLWEQLFDLNRDRIENPDRLPIGLVIRLPRTGPVRTNAAESPLEAASFP